MQHWIFMPVPKVAKKSIGQKIALERGLNRKIHYRRNGLVSHG